MVYGDSLSKEMGSSQQTLGSKHFWPETTPYTKDPYESICMEPTLGCVNDYGGCSSMRIINS